MFYDFKIEAVGQSFRALRRSWLFFWKDEGHTFDTANLAASYIQYAMGPS
jgi:hypothetical protein